MGSKAVLTSKYQECNKFLIAETKDILKNYYDINKKLNNTFHKIIDYEKELHKYELEKSKYILSSKLAHDIRSPINSLKIILGNLGENIDKNQVSLIQKQFSRITDLTEEIVAANLQKNFTVEKAIACNLNEILPDLVIEKKLQFEDKLKIQFTCENLLNKPLISNINPNELMSVLSNLINNSFESYEGKSGEVILSLAQLNKNYHTIKVTDFGKGIKSADISKLGAEGYSIGKAANTISGFGLGLYFAKLTLEKWQGKLFIDSQEHRGTTVTLQIPVLE